MDAIKECKIHGLTNHRFDKNGKNSGHWRCKACGVIAVQKRRENLKLLSIEYKGGKCSICGYNKYTGALEFHHLDPNEKEFGISSGCTKSFEKIKIELNKCILICSNCHRELHNSIHKAV